MRIRFYLDSKQGKDGDSPITVSIAPKGCRFYTSTGYRISQGKWNPEKQEVRRGAVNAQGLQYSAINAGLDGIRAHFGRLDDTGRAWTKTEIQEEWNAFRGLAKHKPSADEPEKRTVKALLLEFTQEQGALHSWTQATHKKYKTITNHLERFNPGATDIDDDFLRGFVRYLIDAGFKNEYIARLSRSFGTFLRWAMRRGHWPGIDMESLKPHLATTRKPVVFLTLEEVAALNGFPLPESKQYLSRVRDFFCFCCYTGLRYSDAVRVTWANVDEAKGVLRVTTRKDKDLVEIPLIPQAKEIMGRYKGKLDGGKLVPSCSNQKTNAYIKELCRLCGLDAPVQYAEMRGSRREDFTVPKWQEIGTHCGRKTFVVQALSSGIPAQTVMKITGHSDFNAMRPYIDIADDAKREAMGKLADRFA